jgi:hypothetical protein
MIMATVWMWALLISSFMAVIVCYWLATQALFPSLTARCRTRYEQPLRISLVGLAAATPLLLASFALMSKNNPAIKITGIGLLAVPIVCGLVGSAGLCQRIGAGMPSLSDEQQPWRRVLRGGIVLVFVFLMPVFGWVILLPWTLISGLGAAILSRRAEEPTNVPAPATAIPVMNQAV